MNLRKFECSECFKMFKSRDNLHDHMTKHPRPIEVSPADLALYRAHTPHLSLPVPIPRLTDLVSMSAYPMEEDRVVIPRIEVATQDSS